MDFVFDNLFMVIGLVLCLLAVVQLTMWSAESWQIHRQSKAQLDLAKSLLEQQLRNARNQAIDNPIAQNPTLAQPAPAELQVNQDGTWSGFRKFRVMRVESENATCKSIYLSPVDSYPLPTFRGGQHLPIRFEIQGEQVVRCYSLSNGPGNDHYRISVKRVDSSSPEHPPGLVSHYIHNTLKVGEILEVKRPSGSFYWDNKQTTPLVMLAGGIGITPMISTIQEARSLNSTRPLILFYGCRTQEEQAFYDWLVAIAHQMNNLYLFHCYSNDQPPKNKAAGIQLRGRVHLDLLKQALPDQNCEFLLCGPPAFIHSLVAGLESWGVPEAMIKMEAFGPASRLGPHRKSKQGSTTCNVRFSRSGKTVAWDGTQESLLDLAERSGIELESGCRAGSCGTCATRLVRGEVEYDDEAECEPGECLVCIARPLQDVELDA